MNELKMKYSHTQDKRFYMTAIMTGSMMAHIYTAGSELRKFTREIPEIPL